MQTDNRARVLYYPVDIVDLSAALQKIEGYRASRQSAHVVTMNAEMVVQAQKDRHLSDIINGATLVVPDGAGVVFAIKLSGQAGPDGCVRVPGVELSLSALQAAAKKGLKVALIGGKPEVMQKLAAKLQTEPQFDGIKLVAAQDGYFDKAQEAAIIQNIADMQPDLVLVALGVPKQEFFIDKYRHLFTHSVMIGVGGSFDVWTGTVERAPESYQKMHLEWLYRLKKEPWRFSRMASTLPNFALQVLFKMVLLRKGLR